MYTRAVLRHKSALIGGIVPLIAAGSITIGVTRDSNPDAPEALRGLWKTRGE